ncbi:uncharacterized protein LOC144547193 [Carex rostrata]
MLQAGKYLRITLRDEGAFRGLLRKVVRSGDPLLEVFACRINRESGARYVSYYGHRIEYKSELAAGQFFANKKQLTKKIREYHVDKNQEIYTKRSDTSKLEIRCRTSGCRFKLKARATKIGDTWKITEQDTAHTCTSEYTRIDHAQLTASIIADIIGPNIKENPTMSIRSVAHCVKVRFGSITPKYNKLWRGRELAVARQFGSWKESYNFMKLLLLGICDKNPGSRHLFRTKPSFDKDTGLVKQGVVEFVAVAWAYGPCITAFGYLRPVISIDAAFLSGRYEGRLLMACGYNAENQLLPLAFAIVQKENEDNWGWFLHWLRINVIGVNIFVCVISDQHKGIKAALKPEYGWDSDNFVHRYCIQHVADNLVQACGKDAWYGTRFKLGARKKKPRRLKEMFEDFAMQNPRCNVFLRRVGKVRPNDVMEQSNFDKIFQTCDGGYRFGIMTTNGSESLNAVFKESRMLPVAALVEETFYKCNSWFVQRRQAAMEQRDAGKPFSERVHVKLAKRWVKAIEMDVIAYSHGEGSSIS